MKLSKLFWVGLIISITTIGFVLGLLYLQEISIKKTKFSFTVIFDNVQGLNEGDNVNMLGKRIGKVSKTQIIGQQIAIELSIDNSFVFQIPVDSKIEIRTEGLMGEKYISIEPGIDTKHAILAGDTIQGGAREVDIAEITPGIVPITRDLAVFTRRLKSTLGEEEKDKIKETIKNIEELTGEMTSLTQEFRDVLRNEERENIHKFIENLKTISDSLKMNLNSDFHKIDRILDEVQVFSASLKDLTVTFAEIKSSSRSFSESAVSFSEVVAKLKEATGKLDSTSGTLPRLLNDNSVYNNLDSLVLDLRWLTKDFKENPTKYMKAYWKSKK